MLDVLLPSSGSFPFSLCLFLVVSLTDDWLLEPPLLEFESKFAMPLFLFWTFIFSKLALIFSLSFEFSPSANATEMAFYDFNTPFTKKKKKILVFVCFCSFCMFIYSQWLYTYSQPIQPMAVYIQPIYTANGCIHTANLYSPVKLLAKFKSSLS